MRQQPLRPRVAVMRVNIPNRQQPVAMPLAVAPPVAIGIDDIGHIRGGNPHPAVGVLSQCRQVGFGGGG